MFEYEMIRLVMRRRLGASPSGRSPQLKRTHPCRTGLKARVGRRAEKSTSHRASNRLAISCDSRRAQTRRGQGSGSRTACPPANVAVVAAAIDRRSVDAVRWARPLTAPGRRLDMLASGVFKSSVIGPESTSVG